MFFTTKTWWTVWGGRLKTVSVYLRILNKIYFLKCQKKFFWVLKWVYSRMFLGRQQCLSLKKTVSSCWKGNVRGYSYKLLSIGILVVYIAQCSHFWDARINKKSLFYASLQKLDEL